jgi:outer membrane protein
MPSSRSFAVSSTSRSSITRWRTAAAGCVAIALGAVFADARAQQPPDAGASEGTTWGLGLGVISEQKPYVGVDRDYQALPVLLIENRYVRLFGPSVELKLPSLDLSSTQRLDFRLVARYSLLGGYEADDSPALAGMADRKRGFWAGGKAKWQNEVADVSAEWLGDVSSYSKGQRFSLGVERNFRLGQSVMLTPYLVGHWVDKKAVNYYFGVRDDEVAAGRPAYAGESGFNTELGLRAMYRLDAHQSLILDLSATSLSDGIKNSPIVDRSSQNRVLLSYMYRF